MLYLQNYSLSSICCTKFITEIITTLKIHRRKNDKPSFCLCKAIKMCVNFYIPTYSTCLSLKCLFVVCVCVCCLCGLVPHAGPVDLSIQAKCDPCLSSPCKNDGTCSGDPVHYYRCTCPYGFKVLTFWKL